MPMSTLSHDSRLSGGLNVCSPEPGGRANGTHHSCRFKPAETSSGGDRARSAATGRGRGAGSSRGRRGEIRGSEEMAVITGRPIRQGPGLRHESLPCQQDQGHDLWGLVQHEGAVNCQKTAEAKRGAQSLSGKSL